MGWLGPPRKTGRPGVPRARSLSTAHPLHAARRPVTNPGMYAGVAGQAPHLSDSPIAGRSGSPTRWLPSQNARRRQGSTLPGLAPAAAPTPQTRMCRRAQIQIPYPVRGPAGNAFRRAPAPVHAWSREIGPEGECSPLPCPLTLQTRRTRYNHVYCDACAGPGAGVRAPGGEGPEGSENVVERGGSNSHAGQSGAPGAGGLAEPSPRLGHKLSAASAQETMPAAIDGFIAAIQPQMEGWGVAWAASRAVANPGRRSGRRSPHALL